jgi:hypothetical protein
MLRDIARQLDDWVTQRNREARVEGWAAIPPCKIRVVGQTALLEHGAPLTLAATRDVDVIADYEHTVETEFRRLLSAHGRDLDPLGHEIWMPKETEYSVVYKGRWVELSLADADAILVSKALKAPSKNRSLLLEFLARGASPRFLALARKYKLDLEKLA